jgi:hypothetical protein
MQSPEQLARENIDKLLAGCGWKIQKRSEIIGVTVPRSNQTICRLRGTSLPEDAAGATG